jgi:deazaflavin-dependent oxidoreductase (nitroreductase family)
MAAAPVKFPLWQRWIQRLAATREAGWVLARLLHRLDGWVLAHSGGKATATHALTGLPVGLLITTGAKSGREHTVPLVLLADGEKWVLMGTAFGSRKDPAWVRNLRLFPHVRLRHNQSERSYLAREVQGAEFQCYWQQAVELYRGYSGYARRAGRPIPVIILTPDPEQPAVPHRL